MFDDAAKIVIAASHTISHNFTQFSLLENLKSGWTVETSLHDCFLTFILTLSCTVLCIFSPCQAQLQLYIFYAYILSSPCAVILSRLYLMNNNCLLPPVGPPGPHTSSDMGPPIWGGTICLVIWGPEGPNLGGPHITRTPAVNSDQFQKLRALTQAACSYALCTLAITFSSVV